MIDVREIKLSRRYPESRQEDITDAFTRGYTGAVEIGNKAIEKLEAENTKLRELVQDFDKCLDAALCLAHDAGYPVMPDQKLFDSLRPRMRELGIEEK